MEQSQPTNSHDAMAEEIFALTVLAWRERLASRQRSEVTDLSESQFLTLLLALPIAPILTS